MAESKSIYESASEVEAIVRGFEACSIPPSEFKHRAHLTVALWYLKRLPSAEATASMRASLFRFINHHGAQGYNETLTIFWLRLVRRFLDDAPPASSILELANLLTATYGDSRLVFDYYSRELLSSPEAKASWVEPDLKALDF
ncbi:MAG TPA: hypothetical protein VGX92_10035 [Pyrinomonadaceae bacterium]|jgi:hypothetical protein|nr:hypothetical protein [Pyrinomonadaceae bacterium]